MGCVQSDRRVATARIGTGGSPGKGNVSMCGLCGFTGEIVDRDKVLENMTDVITHRGPDSVGYYKDSRISMGFRRLSIIDLEGGHQPIYNEDKSLVLMFNGEIYNYKELREELIG